MGFPAWFQNLELEPKGKIVEEIYAVPGNVACLGQGIDRAFLGNVLPEILVFFHGLFSTLGPLFGSASSEVECRINNGANRHDQTKSRGDCPYPLPAVAVTP